jgi:hypothetical protein
MKALKPFLASTLALVFSAPAPLIAQQAAVAERPADQDGWAKITEDEAGIYLETDTLTATFRKKASPGAATFLTTGVAATSFLDKRTGFRDPGYGLDVVDWILQDGSDDAYEDRLPEDLRYRHEPEILHLIHGDRPKRKLEGPQICQVHQLRPRVIRGNGFVAVETTYAYNTAAPPYKPGSKWTQYLVFPKGQRYFISMDRIDCANDYEQVYLRIDMPGHLRHNDGDTFSEIYLSYHGGPDGSRLPSNQFHEKFPPDGNFNYRRDRDGVPGRFIRAYRLRDPKTGSDGPWLAGMTLNPAGTHEAWCNNVRYVCFIQEVGPSGPVKAGQSFSTAFIVGYFDSVEQMQQVYDQYKGFTGLKVDETGWELTK